MTKKQLALLLLAILVAGTYWYLTTERFHRGPVKITVRTLPNRVAEGRGLRVGPARNPATGSGRAPANNGNGRRGNMQGGRAGAVPSTPATVPAPTSPTMVFEFDRKLAFTSIKVFPVSELETNAALPHPVWQVVGDTNTLPTKGFAYGENPANLRMRLAVAGIDAEPLEPGVEYRMFIQAGPIKAERDFKVPAAKP
jgi:hypothetical protein